MDYILDHSKKAITLTNNFISVVNNNTVTSTNIENFFNEIFDIESRYLDYFYEYLDSINKDNSIDNLINKYKIYKDIVNQINKLISINIDTINNPSNIDNNITDANTISVAINIYYTELSKNKDNIYSFNILSIPQFSLPINSFVPSSGDYINYYISNINKKLIPETISYIKKTLNVNC
jgi:hypothetical protein